VETDISPETILTTRQKRARLTILHVEKSMSVSRNSEKSNTFEISNKTKVTLPGVPFRLIKEAVLGKKYNLSLVFIGEKRSQKLNATYRNKNKPTNILSFPLSETEGEIFIDLARSRKEAPLFDRSFDNFIAFLFIHGLFHLKGYNHGSTMESKEERIRKKFNI
jgi:rRNA maturation RNase YbeY